MENVIPLGIANVNLNTMDMTACTRKVLFICLPHTNDLTVTCEDFCKATTGACVHNICECFDGSNSSFDCAYAQGFFVTVVS